ncbi:dehydrogenase E1 component subunit alpha/beta [Aquimarina sp. ERC-38]|uniref:alpha-ketoacid dehydrogenase subunit alpha/beta n=1 Tax=Aquimarina sp. ERC-38 TaxID=2949996 RepID=UPI002247488A|nr:dehydrogenase E1 component subunit alpha/beta [Aquimarina sp. ERC-38]UZO80250.1 dehydrogenase E1 component subunit alpha/beta [Aquimarina sp. ERC-38]
MHFPETVNFKDSSLPEATLLLKLYEEMLKSRMIEEKMLVLLRQGKISKWFSGIGQEAISVGVASVLNNEEYILPMHRNLGVFTTRKVPLYHLFSQWQGKPEGFTKGRDRSFHFGSQEHKIVGMISHLGPQLGVACGIALADKMESKNSVTAVFTGDGGTSEGDFHEALNLASVWQLPVLFCIENNGYGLSTPTSEQYACEHLADRGKGYGMKSFVLDGNNIVEIYQQLSEIVTTMRENPQPVLIEFKTFRIRGHEEASGTAYVPEEVLALWKRKDPVVQFEHFLREKGILTEVDKNNIRQRISKQIQIAWEQTIAQPEVVPDISTELEDVFAPYSVAKNSIQDTTYGTQEIRFIDAISMALRQAMQKYDRLLIMGQDIAEYGGVFKITDGFTAEFGKDRVRNTPICESIIVSTAYGLSVEGHKSVVEMQFADFVSSGFNPIVNLLAKSYYRWGQPADVVVRMPCGGGVGAGPFHSQTNEAWFTKVPGLKVVYPAFPEDAKVLLLSAIEDPNPVLFFEHKALYRTVKGLVTEDDHTLPLGQAKVLQQGNDLTIVTYGAGVHWVLEFLESSSDLHIDLIDLRCLQPLDTETIFESVQKTGKLLILQEDSLFGGMASEIAALVAEHCFEYLDAPVRRVASLDTPIPFQKNLEQQYLGKERLEQVIAELLAY